MSSSFVLFFVNSKMISIFVFVTIILDFCNSELYHLEDPIVILTDLHMQLFELSDRWNIPSPEIIKYRRDNICEPIKKAAKIYEFRNENVNPVRNNFPYDARRSGPPAHDNEFNAVLEWKGYFINLFPCQWPADHNQDVWFYLAMADNFKCYILFVNHESMENPSLRPVGVVMECLKLKEIPNGHLMFQKIFSDYTDKLSEEKYSQEVSVFNAQKATPFEEYYKTLELCGTVLKTLHKMEDRYSLDTDYPRKDFLFLLPYSSNLIKFLLNKPRLTLRVATCKTEFTDIKFECDLIRVPESRDKLFVVYNRNNEKAILLFQFLNNLYRSYIW